MSCKTIHLDSRGDLVVIAMGIISLIIAVAIGYLIILNVKNSIPTAGLTSDDNASLQSFVGSLASIYQFFTVVVLVAMAGIVIYVLRQYGGGGTEA